MFTKYSHVSIRQVEKCILNLESDLNEVYSRNTFWFFERVTIIFKLKTNRFLCFFLVKKIEVIILAFFPLRNVTKIFVMQKEPSRGVLRKRCSENMQPIYRRTHMPKCDINKVAKQLYWNHTSAWVFSCKFDSYFQNTFSQEHLWVAASDNVKLILATSFKKI